MNKSTPSSAAKQAIHEAIDRPLLMLPASLRIVANNAHMCYSTLYGMDTPLPLCAPMAAWLARGLSIESAQAMLAQCIDPTVMARVRTAHDLIQILAGWAMEAIRRDRSREEARRIAAEDDAARAAASEVNRLADYFGRKG